MERKPTMLVVDDEYGLRDGITRIFTLEGYEVDAAPGGEEGIRKGLEKEYDIVLLDLMMPDTDGLTVLKRLRAEHPDTEYLIITAFAGIDSAVEATKIGASTYIPKPFTPDQIIFEARRAMEKRRLALEARELRAEQERRLLEIHLEKSRLRTIINAISDAVFVTNLEREIVLANPRSRAMLSIPSGVRAGMKIEEALPPEVVDLVDEASAKVSDGVELVSREWEAKAELELVLSMRTVPLRDMGDAVIGFVTTIQDVTERKRLDLQKSRFVSMVAHELKAPLAAVSGYLETMRGGHLGDSLASYARMLDRSSERLSALIDLINDLLNISRAELGAVRREIVAVSVAQAVAQVADLFRAEMDRAAVALEVSIPEDLPAVEIDPEEFTRLLTNLVSNAIKYNRPGGKISIAAEKSDSSVRISVRDTGIGMKEEDVGKLFRQFFRVKDERTRSIPGTGLGLSIVKSIVESYSGTISAESAYGKGTKFVIELPTRVVEKDVTAA